MHHQDRPYRNAAMEKKNHILAELNTSEFKTYEKDFDFAKSNSLFKTEDIRGQFKKEVELSRATGFTNSNFVVRSGYKPTSSFYDDISSGLRQWRPAHSYSGGYNSNSRP